MNVEPIMAFLKEALVALRKFAETNPVPTGRDIFEFSENGYEGRHVEDSRWDIFVWQFFRDGNLGALSSAEPAARSIHPELPLPGWNVLITAQHSIDEVVPWVRHSLMPVLIDHLQRGGKYEGDDALLRECLERRIAHWVARDRVDEATIPLFGLESELESIHLDEDIEIVKFTNDKKQKLWSQGYSELGLTTAIMPFATSLFRVRCLSGDPRPVSATLIPTFERAGRAVTALRLLDKGDVFAAGVFSEALPPLLSPPGPVQLLSELRHVGFLLGASYKLPALRVTGLQGLFRDLEACAEPSKTDQLALPLRRFDLSYSREHHEDALIDLVVALEATLLSDNITSEVRFRFALRGAALLAPTEGASSAFAFMQNYYDTRSKIVHGGATLSDLQKRGKIKAASTSEYVDRCRSHTRSILRFYVGEVARGVSLAAVTESINEKFLAGLDALHG